MFSYREETAVLRGNEQGAEEMTIAQEIAGLFCCSAAMAAVLLALIVVSRIQISDLLERVERLEKKK